MKNQSLIIILSIVISICKSQSNYSLSFDGVDDYVELGSSSIIAGSSYTIEIKAKKYSNPNTYNTLISSGPRLHGNLEAYIMSDGKFTFSHFQSGEPVTTNLLTSEVWYSLAFSFNYSSSEGKVYIDGVLEDTNTLGFNFGNGGNYQSSNFLVGNASDQTAIAFDGNIDEVRVWNYEKTQTEIIEDQNIQLTGSESGLVGYWNFNEGSGSVVTDLSSNGNDGTIYGATWSTDVIQESQICIFLDSVSAFPNDTILVGVNVDFPEDSTFSSAELSFGGFQGNLDFLEVDTSNSLSGSADWTIVVNETDSLLITASGGSNTIGSDSVLFYLKFIVADTVSAGFIPITIEYALFDETDLTIETISGGVTIQVPDYGDVSLNGEIHAYDASLILKYLVGTEVFNNQQLLNANVSLDTSVSALDASLIFQNVVGLIDTLPYDSTMGSLAAAGDIGMTDNQYQYGEQIEIPISLSNGDNILSLESRISFNPDHLVFSEIIWSEEIAHFSFEVFEANGEIIIAGAGSEADGAEGIMITLVFEQTENFDESETIISFVSHRWNEEQIINNVASATLSFQLNTNEMDGIINEFSLHQNYPNPFNPITTIRYDVPAKATSQLPLQISIYDITGQIVTTLVDRPHSPGRYNVKWDATEMASGMYFYRINAGEFTATKKLVLLK